jgi:signal transduction histidine kinase
MSDREANLATSVRLPASTSEDASLQAVIDAVGHGLWLELSSGTHVNAAARRLLALPDGDPPALWALQPRRLDGTPVETPAGFPEGRSVRSRIRRRDGVEVVLDATRSPVLGASGEALGTLVVFEVAECAEERPDAPRLAQSGKLATLGELAPGVGHEINNPLFAVLTLAELLLEDAEPATEQHERLVLLRDAALEIKEIVRAFLRFARTQPGEQQLVDLGAVVGETVEFVRRTTSAKAVQIEERHAAEPLVVRASANELQQVLLNLLTNAQHAMPDGGTVSVEVCREGEWAVARVTDAGVGIDPALKPRIFEPFFTTRRATGSGLGLAAGLDIARAHGGTLVAESEPGYGATLTLRLPLASEEAA